VLNALYILIFFNYLPVWPSTSRY